MSSSPISRVAIIGSGPSGCYTAKSLLKIYDSKPIQIDIFDILPKPYGLLQYGVAPDHPEVKNLSKQFDSELFQDKRVRFHGLAKFPSDISFDYLKTYFHAVVFAYGSDGDKSLGIPGENLSHVIQGRQLVQFYNCHPHSDSGVQQHFEKHFVNSKSIAILGNGNVSLDIARLLTLDIHSLESTDISKKFLEIRAKNSTIENIHIIGRRGPLQSSFTTKELRELASVCDLYWYNNNLTFLQDLLHPQDLETYSESRPLKRKFSQIVKLIHPLISNKVSSPDSHHKQNIAKIIFHWYSSPIEILDKSLTLQKCIPNEKGNLADRGVDTIDEMYTIPVDMVIPAIGYQSLEKHPFLPISDKNRLENNMGYVKNIDDLSVFTSGWLKRGAKGIIDTNRICSHETAISISQTLGNVDNLMGKQDPLISPSWSVYSV